MAQALIARFNSLRARQGGPPFDHDLDALSVPDSAACRGAVELVTEVSEPWLANHCLRTHLWAWLLGKSEGRAFDEELLFVSAILHDLGLTAGGSRLTTQAADCFAVEGAFAAEAFLERAGFGDAGRRRRSAEAIAMHLNVRVPPAAGTEAYLLHEGAALDVVGARIDEIGASTREQALTRHPRLEMKAGLAEAMKAQSRARPGSRAALLCRFGFIPMIRRAPFAG
jgi:hypothetical protein